MRTVQEQRSYRTNNERIGRNGYARRNDNTGGFAGQGLISSIQFNTHKKDTRSRSIVAEESPSDTPRVHRAHRAHPLIVME